MKIIKRTALVFIIVLITGYLIISWNLSNLVLFPVSSLEKTKKDIRDFWGTTYDEILASMPEPENFTIQSFDGLTLKGKYFQQSDSSKCALIFAHGWGETWAGMLKYVPAFEDCNCDLVLYDHRTHGESDGKYSGGTVKEAKDLLSITEWVVDNKTFDRSQIGWVGSSWGAATSLIAGADEQDVAFIVVDAPFQDWETAVFERAIKDYGAIIKLMSGGVMATAGFRAGVKASEASPLLNADKISEPVLLIHSKTDSATAYQQSVNLSAKLNDASESHFTEWGNDHVMDVITNQSDFKALVHDFLERKRAYFLE